MSARRQTGATHASERTKQRGCDAVLTPPGCCKNARREGLVKFLWRSWRHLKICRILQGFAAHK